MDTITRLITIMTKQNGYMIYAEDFLRFLICVTQSQEFFS